MRNAIVFSMGNGKGDGSIMFCHCLDEGFEVLRDHMDVVSCLWVGRFVTEDGFAEGDGVVDLGLGRMYCLKNRDSNSFNLGRGRGEAREVFLNLTGCRVGSLLANIPF